MDVTSLLNTSNIAVAAEQQKQQGRGDRPIAPSRNRTPWDAGGYSLPINTLNHSTNITNTVSGNESNGGSSQIHSYDTQPQELAKSPHHKFSDSRSSLSSFTSTSNSTANSTTHSRFSSMSTVNSIHPFSFNNNSNLGLEKTTESNYSSDTTTTPQIEYHSAPTSPHDTRGILIPSPTESLDALAAIAIQGFSQRSPKHIKNRSQSLAAIPSSIMADENQIENQAVQPEQPEELEQAHGSNRPNSPSDAMLIRRTAANENNGELEATSDSELKNTQPSSAASSEDSKKSHKRTASTPNFPVARPSQANRSLSSSVGRATEPTPPASHHQHEIDSQNGDDSYAAPDTPEETHIDLNQPIQCMYIENCDTNSQPRKAISHIFGRNKMCTRLIPQSVWVHYCRKHYQRSRYRNPKEYAKLQCDLVQTQIRRVHDWSQQNLNRGEAGVVQDWGLAVRKREQKRLDELNGSNRKRHYNEEDDGADNEEGANQGSRPATAVPDWLLALCGKGYTTGEILALFNRLHQDVLDDKLPCFPDIEILPNIVVDQEEPKSPKGYAKRKPSGAGHKRSQSLGVGLGSGNRMAPPQFSTPDRRMSQPVVWQQTPGTNSSAMPQDSPLKRQRRSEVFEDGSPRQPSQLPAPGQHQQFPQNFAFGRRPQVPHRPVFSDIDEDRQVQMGPADNAYAPAPFSRGRSYNNSPSAFQAPLPAPTPQRYNARSVANMNPHEGNNEYTMHSRRDAHQRSQSDMSFPRQGGGMNAMSGGQGQGQNYGQNLEFHVPQYTQQQIPYHSVQQYRDERPRQQSYGGNGTVSQSHLQAVQQAQGHMRHSSSPMGRQNLRAQTHGNARESPSLTGRPSSVSQAGNAAPANHGNGQQHAQSRNMFERGRNFE